MPQTPAERRWWVLVSLTAGVTEELTWRGIQVQILATLLGSYPIAALICSVTFGVGHLGQGRRWAAAVAGFALIFHGLVWVSGSLWVAIAVHVVVDLVGGFSTAWIGRLFGYGESPFLSPRDRARMPLHSSV